MDLGLTGRSVIVTGASRGIGYAIAETFAAEGARLTIAARTEAPLLAARDRLAATGAQVHAVVCDTTSATDCERLIAEAVRVHGGLHVLVNNAGGSVRSDDFDTRWGGTFDANVRSVARLCLLARPYLAASGDGAIVNIASIYGRETGGGIEYNAMKSAEIALSKAFALDWAREGVRVNSIAPGSTLFEGGGWWRRQQDDPEAMRRFVDSDIAAGRFGRPEEIAAAAVFLASPRASWIIGASLNVDGGQSRSNI